MGGFAGQFNELTRSRLVQTLAVGSVVIVFFNLMFLMSLADDTMRSDKQRTHETQLISIGQKISALSKALIQHRILLDRTLRDPDSARDENRKLSHTIREKTKSLKKTWEATGAPGNSVSEIEDLAIQMLNYSDAIYSEGTTNVSTRRQAFNEYSRIAMKLYMLSITRMQAVHEKALSEKAPQSDFDPMILCMVAGSIDLIACLLSGWFIITRITAPIARLSNSCKNLMVGKVIPAPSAGTRELVMLGSTFHDMSSVVAETETSRVDFLKQMQSVQEVTLENVQGYVEELAASASSRPGAADVFKLMKANIEGMLFLLSSMTYGLNFNPDEELDLKPTATSTTELLEHTSKTVTWLMKRKKIELIVEDPGVELECDVHLIERVILNLLSNASKFSANRSQIKLSARVLDDGIRFSVRDFGCGISAENQAKLFQKFSMVDAVDGKQRAGSGLGLMICKNIVNAHGSDIICESIENEGTCFWFKLPFKQSSRATNTSPAPETRRSIYGGKYTRNLVFLIIAYACIQGVLMLNLGVECQQVRKSTAEFARQKALTLGIQELIASFMAWRQSTIQAVTSGDMQTFMDVHPMMVKQQDRIDALLAVCDSTTPERPRLQALKTDMEQLSAATDRVVDKYTEGNLLNTGKDYARALKLGNRVENNLYALFFEQGDGLNTKNDLHTQLLDKILRIVIQATAVNIVMFVLVCWMGFSLVSKVTELNAKALKFAFGGDLTRTIFGKNDELAFLDESLCEVAQKVRAGQRQRQDLMAIINHDLRTPLGAFLNGLEMLSAGMIGDLSDEDNRLVEQAETEVKGVLSIIDDFLSEEKAEFEAS